ncbi:elongation factor G-binding protein [Paenibacillus albiflavus]|uniref:Elongation factor G-binding protein n=1 Tax=Paenibacillus albiflavus TaxID=2545760 RepID=A0A4R4EJ36_9BACL|nr:FusB/FusC family EF-G-binding protein [Paenibacillus albiflavus]TCZ80186.1 elongation factor G-binding protein [Paenibacillus albiflavus]
MTMTFIRNHQYNLITRQVGLLQQAYDNVSDKKVINGVKNNIHARIIAAFPEATELQIEQLDQAAALSSNDDCLQYLSSLKTNLIAFDTVTEKQIKKLFPKIKKLKVLDLESIDYRYITYLGWTDIATNRLFIVYHLNGKLVGIEGRYTPLTKKSTCFLCNRPQEVALYSAITKFKPTNAASDYYKAIGNYMCVDSTTCNKHITDVAKLEKFITDVVG